MKTIITTSFLIAMSSFALFFCKDEYFVWLSSLALVSVTIFTIKFIGLARKQWLEK